jgi:hypothetical protein
MKLIFRVHNRKTLVVNKAVGAKDIERQVLIRVWPTLAIPLLADDGRVAVGIKQESFIG